MSPDLDATSPPPIPTAADFPDLLERGLGRAVCYLQGHDDTPFRWLIADACRHYYAYQDLEPHRAEYLYDLIQASRAPQFYRQIILNALARPQEDDYADQLLHLASFFARDGDPEMRRAFYAAFAQNLITNRRLDGDDALLALDGLDGYQRAARLLMDHPVSADVYWQEDGLWRDAVEKFGEPAVMALGDGDSRLAAYLTRVQFQWHQGQAELDAPRPVPTYEEIKQSITPPPLKGYVSLSWDKRLAPKVIRQLEEDMKQETHPDVLCRYLHLFQFVRRLPDLAPFLNLTRHADPTVVRRAVRVLERTTHPSIRARAGELLSGTSPDDVRNGIELLVANPGSGDYPHIADAVYRAGDQGQDALHTVTLAARDYLRAHAAPERVPIALFLYENIVCTQCRTAAVEVLKDADALPGWLRAEARWDAELEIRALVAG